MAIPPFGFNSSFNEDDDDNSLMFKLHTNKESMTTTPVGKDPRRVTPTDEVTFDFPDSDPDGCHCHGHDEGTTEEWDIVQSCTYIPSPKCKPDLEAFRRTTSNMPNRSTLPAVLLTKEFPLLTGGLKRISDIRKVLDEAARYLGLQDVLKAILEKSETASSIRVPKQGGSKNFI